MEAPLLHLFLLFICFTSLMAATAVEFEVELVPVALPPLPGPLVHPHTALAPHLAPSHHHTHGHHHAPAPAPAHHHHQHSHHAHAPAPAPIHAPAHSPSHSPAHAPSHAPAVHPHGVPRSFIAVQGVVYCKPCKYAGVDTLIGASPLLGAEVKLVCNNTKKPVTATTKTDMHGYFFLSAPKTITTYAFHKCKATLVSSPVPSCSKPSALHGGHDGAVLRPVKPFMANKLPFVLYSVGPFAFDSQCPH